MPSNPQESNEPTNQFHAAIEALRTIAYRGYPEHAPDEPAPAMRTSYTILGKDRTQAATLIQVAAHMIDPESAVKYDVNSGRLAVSFAARFEKPPIRAMRTKIEEIQKRILNAITNRDDGDYEIYYDPHRLPLDIPDFMAQFATAEHPAKFYYKIEEGTLLIGRDGRRHSGFVTSDVVDEYFADHPELGIKDSSEVPCAFAVIAPATMQLALKALGVPETRGQHAH